MSDLGYRTIVNNMLLMHADGALTQQLRRIPPDRYRIGKVENRSELEFAAFYGAHDSARASMRIGAGAPHPVGAVWDAVMELERQALDIISARDGIRDLVDQ